VNYDRRTIVISALVMIAVLLGGVALVAVTSDAGDETRTDTQSQLPGDSGGAAPNIIPRPGEGKAPAAPNERGGSEQLALFGLVLAAMVGIGVVLFRGGKKARAGRAEWAAAGRTGQDGIMAAHGQLAPDADLTPAEAPTATERR
jgi:uncharacterized protein HemX